MTFASKATLLTLLVYQSSLAQDELSLERSLPSFMTADPSAPRASVNFIPIEFRDEFEEYATNRELPCFESVDVYDGDEYIIRSPGYPNDAPRRNRCVWRFNVKPGVNTDVMCQDFDVPCRSRSRLFFKLRRRWQGLCSWRPQLNQRIRIRTSPYEFRMTIVHSVRRSPTGRLSCMVRGVGGASRPGSNTTTTAPPTTTTARSTSASTSTISNQPTPSTTPTASTPGSNSTATSTMSSSTTTTSSTTSSPPAALNCGRRLGKSSKIVNGNQAEMNEYPWMAYLILGGSACGGTVINNNWILTAAHCSVGTSEADIRVFLGCHNLQQGSCDPQRSVSVNRLHPNYNSVSLENDIALLKLSAPITFNGRIQPVCLPSANVGGDYTMVTTGWGRIETGGDSSPFLKEAIVKSITDEQCERSFSIQESVLCTEAVDGSTCQGDSGGFLGSQRNGRFEQDGITSFGSAEGCGVDGLPDGFTEVRFFVDWINRNAFAEP